MNRYNAGATQVPDCKESHSYDKVLNFVQEIENLFWRHYGGCITKKEQGLQISLTREGLNSGVKDEATDGVFK